MKTLVALYHSTIEGDEEYWNIKDIAKTYEIKITPIGEKDWGGEEIFEVEGSAHSLQEFAYEFCDAETIGELFPTNQEQMA